MSEIIDCPCCGGRGTQYNYKTGLRVICPCCKGAKKIQKPCIVSV